jgi:hypothetical protein
MLLVLVAATSLLDLRIPPANRLEKFGGDAHDVVDYDQESPMPTKRLAPIHPGEILAEEFLQALALTEYRLAKGLRVPAR